MKHPIDVPSDLDTTLQQQQTIARENYTQAGATTGFIAQDHRQALRKYVETFFSKVNPEIIQPHGKPPLPRLLKQQQQQAADTPPANPEQPSSSTEQVPAEKPASPVKEESLAETPADGKEAASLEPGPATGAEPTREQAPVPASFEGTFVDLIYASLLSNQLSRLGSQLKKHYFLAEEVGFLKGAL